MATSTPIATIITYAKISQFLAADDIAKTFLFKGGPPPLQKLSRLIYIVRKQVDLVYTNDPSDSTLDSTANYLYWLCGRYINQAKVILGQGGTGVIVNPTSGALSSLTGVFVQFRIGDVGSLMNAGDTVLTLTYDDPISATVSVDLDGVELPQNDSLQISYTVVYNSSSVVITFNQAVATSQQYQVRFLRFIPIT